MIMKVRMCLCGGVGGGEIRKQGWGMKRERNEAHLHLAEEADAETSF